MTYDPMELMNHPQPVQSTAIDNLATVGSSSNCDTIGHSDSSRTLLVSPPPASLRERPCAASCRVSKLFNAPSNSETITNDKGNVSDMTTLMLRNLPGFIEQCALIDELNRSGFAGLYDFCYLPRCFNTGSSRCYAFVNLVSPAVAASLQGAWHGSLRFGVMLTVAPAEIQGYAANVRQWAGARIRRVKDARHHPFMIQNTCQTVDAHAQASVPTAFAHLNASTLHPRASWRC